MVRLAARSDRSETPPSSLPSVAANRIAPSFVIAIFRSIQGRYVRSGHSLAARQIRRNSPYTKKQRSAPSHLERCKSVYDGASNGSKFWRVESKSLGALARSGLTFSELCALYFSRALIECFAGTHLLSDVQSAPAKCESALTPEMKKFVERLVRVASPASPPGGCSTELDGAREQ